LLCSNQVGVISGSRCGGGGFGEPTLGVDGSRTAGARGGDRLPVGVVDQVARREDAFDRRACGAAG